MDSTFAASVTAALFAKYHGDEIQMDRSCCRLQKSACSLISDCMRITRASTSESHSGSPVRFCIQPENQADARCSRRKRIRMTAEPSGPECQSRSARRGILFAHHPNPFSLPSGTRSEQEAPRQRARVTMNPCPQPLCSRILPRPRRNFRCESPARDTRGADSDFPTALPALYRSWRYPPCNQHRDAGTNSGAKPASRLSFAVRTRPVIANSIFPLQATGRFIGSARIARPCHYPGSTIHPVFTFPWTRPPCNWMLC